jgi:hypothetical protein
LSSFEPKMMRPQHAAKQQKRTGSDFAAVGIRQAGD